MIDSDRIRSRLRGALLGAVIGDALIGAGCGPPPSGASHPAPDRVPGRSELEAARAVLVARQAPAGEGAAPDPLRYSVFAHEALVLAEFLVELGPLPDDLERLAPEPEAIASFLAARRDRSRGAGDGSLPVLDRIAAGGAWDDALGVVDREVAARVGAAARVTPVAAYLHDRPEHLHRLAESTALATHPQPGGIDGAVILAQSLSLLTTVGLSGARLEPVYFFRALVARIMAHGSGESLLEKVGAACDAAATRAPVGVLRDEIGNGLASVEAVPAAIGLVLRAAGEPAAALGLAVMLGGEHAAIGCMVGALVGAYAGEEALPAVLVEGLDRDAGATARARSLADRLVALRGGRAAVS
ncbi:MAG: ADP-ribosylglycohydrolase family protein [Candidatus Eiseniibacteriota bacterium]|jgi:ADP-ribosylglycohydrolase